MGSVYLGILEITNYHGKYFAVKENDKLNDYFEEIKKYITEGDETVKEFVADGILECAIYKRNFLKIAEHFLGDIRWFNETVETILREDRRSHNSVIKNRYIEEWW